MSNNQDWFDDDDFFEDEVEETTQRESRDDVLKKVRRAERAKDKQLKEVLAELESLRKFQREATVSKVLTEKGINPKIAAFIPQDIEVNESSVTSWLEQYGDVFGVAPVQSESNASVDNSQFDAFRQINNATANAVSPDGANDMFSAINNAQSEEDLLRLIYGA